jgi:non-specific protein-tyrosine kinase
VHESEPVRRDFRHYLTVAWRWKWLLLAIVVLVPAAVYAVSSQLSQTYEAKTTLYVQATSVTSTDLADQTAVSTSSPTNVARLVETPLVADLAARQLGEPQSDSRALLKQVSAQLDVSVAPDSDTNFLTISARDGDPQRAADIAQAFARAVAAKRTSQAQRAIDKTLEELNQNAPALSNLGTTAKQQLAGEIQQLQTLRSTQQGATQVVDPVQVPKSPISPRPLRNTALGLIFALLLAAGLVPLLDRLDRKLRQADDLEPLVGAPVLAMIPEQAFPGKVPGPTVREAFQTLRASLTYFNVDRSLKSILVTSPAHGDGKTTVATNLAVALAQDERDVILIDADLRRGQAAGRLGLDATIGLDAVLMEERRIEDALVDVPGVLGGRLRVLAAVTPPPNPSVLLGSQRMQKVLEELSRMADIVVLDTPPLLVVSDAIALLEPVSGVVVVARTDYTTTDAVVKTRDVIAAANGTILGAVATGTQASGLYGYDLYGYDVPEGGTQGALGTDLPPVENGAGNGRTRLGRLVRRD